MKKIFSTIILLFVIVVSLPIASCGNDSDNPDDPNHEQQDPLAGTDGLLYMLYGDDEVYVTGEPQRSINPWDASAWNPLINRFGNETDRVEYKGDIVIPERVTFDGKTYTVSGIWGAAFEDCIKLTSVKLPSTLKEIDVLSFLGCTELKTISIPASVNKIDGTAFSYCTSLKSINVDPDNSKYVSVDGILYSKSKTSLVSYPCGLEGTAKFLDTVESIGESAFEGSIANSIEFTSSLKYINDSAFYDCINLQSIKVPEGVVRIGDSAFYGCDNMTLIDLPSTLLYIGQYVFFNSSLDVICRATLVPQVIGSSSSRAYLGHANTLYVPASSVKEYQRTNSPYVDCFNYIKPIE